VLAIVAVTDVAMVGVADSLAEASMVTPEVAEAAASTAAVAVAASMAAAVDTAEAAATAAVVVTVNRSTHV
jgi:hypothetical protein